MNSNSIASIMSTILGRGELPGNQSTTLSGSGDPALNFAATLERLTERSLKDQLPLPDGIGTLSAEQLQALAALAGTAGSDLRPEAQWAEQARAAADDDLLLPWLMEQSIELGLIGANESGNFPLSQSQSVADLPARAFAAVTSAVGERFPSQALLQGAAADPKIAEAAQEAARLLSADGEFAKRAAEFLSQLRSAAAQATATDQTVAGDGKLGGSLREASLVTGQTQDTAKLQISPAQSVAESINATSQVSDLVERGDSGVRDPAASGSLTAASLAGPASPATSSPAPTGAPTALAQLQASIGSPQWAQEFGEQVLGFTLRGEQQIALHLNPRELGPLMVEVTLVNNQAQLQFLSNQQAVRAAVEQALPDLREVFEQQGIALGDANVSEHQHSGRDGRGSERGPASDREQVAEVQSAEEVVLGATEVRELRGQVNVYI